MRHVFRFGFAAMFCCALFLGCSGGVSEDGNHTDHSDEEHGSAEEHEGPHGGHVIELGGNHEYHAELVDDEQASSVTVYILGEGLKELPVATAMVSINLTVSGQPKSFELPAVSATDGKAAQFSSSDKALFQALHEDEATGKLSVTIDGTPYSGPIEHHDDHDDH